MNSSMIGKIEKAHRYAKEPDRFRISQITGTFHGGHDDYVITLGNGTVFLGVEDEQLPGCLRLIKQTCGARIKHVPMALALEGGEAGIGAIGSEQIGGGVVFVARVERFVRIGIDDAGSEAS